MTGRFAQSLLIWGLGLSLACSATGQSQRDGALGDADNTGGAGVGGASGSPGAGGAAGGTAGTAASGGIVGTGTAGIGGRGGIGVTGGASGAAGVGPDDRLLPLEVGRHWTFQLSAPNASLPSNCSRSEASVSGTVTSGTQTGWSYAPTCTDQTYEFFMDGDNIWSFPNAALLAADRVDYASAPVQEGHAWLTANSYRFVWHDAGTVQTPAGSFDRCWQRASVGSTDEYIILCRGTGLVVSNSASANYRLELSSKNF